MKWRARESTAQFNQTRKEPDMAANKVAKLKAVRGGWIPTADDPALRAWAKELAAEFTATTPLDMPPDDFHRALAEFWAGFEKVFAEEARAPHHLLGALRRKPRSELSVLVNSVGAPATLKEELKKVNRF